MAETLQIVSMVPSWTETLIEAGVNVVGRTRFCVHPKNKVDSIPIVGGTKEVNWQKVEELKPDLLLLDKEENPKKMAEQAPCKYIATHISSLPDVSRELKRIADKLDNTTILEFSNRWTALLGHLPLKATSLNSIPGVVSWLRNPESLSDIKTVLYIIWRNPWMSVGRDTFIYSMLEAVGLSPYLPEFSAAYPEISLEDFNPESTLLLMSTEPFPFEQKSNQILEEVSHPMAIVDGEAYSWFGVRSLKFLEQLIEDRV